jgi:transcriptional regulator with XRE-family HTH domain
MLENNNINWASMTDHAIIKVIGSYLRHQRLSQNRTQAQVAKDAGLTRWTMSQIENGGSVTLATLVQIIRVLDLFHLLDGFTIKQEISPMAYARLHEKSRKRARPKTRGTGSKHNTEW